MAASLQTRNDSGQLNLLGEKPPDILIPPADGRRAIEDEGFPFEELSEIAEAESWRKEINRPVYHIHKWWAHRLGSVFRAIAIAAFAPAGSDILDLFYRRTRIPERIVFDPFMGSGTTVGEVAKLGGKAIGRDINPVAYFLVRNALAPHDRRAVAAAFRAIDEDVGDAIRQHYKATLPNGASADVLCFFWVKTLDCPECAAEVDLFASYVFAKHACPSKHPDAHAVCPSCGSINRLRYDSQGQTCDACGEPFNPQAGPARGKNAQCPSCRHVFPIAQRVRDSRRPPRHRLYAKLVLMPDGSKRYLPATEEDRARYAEAEAALAVRGDPFPVVDIQAGCNTNQALGYNYRQWHDMFNARQLLCLSILADRIRIIEDRRVRDLFACLFSGALEFNNQFASYKGEGTGAVRHMFAHHILKPERTPLEANLWGTPKSSGAFSTMFAGRIRRAFDYAENPFEVSLQNGGKPAKVYGLSDRLGSEIAHDYREFEAGKAIYLSCGDSSRTDLPDRSVDAVITDPPFFDNVHYSQLADFFHVWQRHILGATGTRKSETTRADGEVQNGDAAIFTARLKNVWQEACRVLKDDGLLVFTYHHSRPDGWRSVLQALMEADLLMTAAHPVKAEMSVAMPKRQAKEPIDLDIIIACRKRGATARPPSVADDWLKTAESQIGRLQAAGRRLSRNDALIILMAQFLRNLSRKDSVAEALRLLDEGIEGIDRHAGRLHGAEPAEIREKAA